MSSPLATETVQPTLSDKALLTYATHEEIQSDPTQGRLGAFLSRYRGLWVPHTTRHPLGILNHGPRPSTNGVVLHVNDGTFNGTISWFSGGSRGVGAHFEIGNGEAWQLVDIRAKCWHAVEANGHTIGIEHAGFGRSRAEWIHGNELDLSANRVAWILHAYRLGPPRRHHNIFYHSDGGASWGGHACPGSHFPYDVWQKKCKHAYDTHWGH
jgi:N-acetyl-anhydromuramyl-L-alanine amidase AmpD